MTSTPYDDVFRTLLNDCPKLIIPVINEIFGEHYTGKEEIQFFPNEHFLNQQDGKEEKRITDTMFIIKASKPKSYHVECQSTPDNSMLIRTFEYDTQIALDNGKIEESVLTVNFPNSAVLFLRCDKDTPDEMKIRLRTPGGELTYKIPVIKQENYKIEEIFEKNLLFLIPFNIFVHEKQLHEYDTSEEKLENLKWEYRNIRAKLEKLCQEKHISEYTKHMLIDMSKKVLENLACKYQNVTEGVKKVMGGKVLEYEAKTIKKEGIAEGYSQGILQGISQGISQGRIAAYVEMLNAGNITIKEAAKRLNMNEEDLNVYLEKDSNI